MIFSWDIYIQEDFSFFFAFLFSHYTSQKATLQISYFILDVLLLYFLTLYPCIFSSTTKFSINNYLSVF